MMDCRYRLLISISCTGVFSLPAHGAESPHAARNNGSAVATIRAGFTLTAPDAKPKPDAPNHHEAPKTYACDAEGRITRALPGGSCAITIVDLP